MTHISKLIALQAEPVLTVQTQLRDGKFLQTIGGNKICQLLDIEPIKQSLRYAFMLVGLRANNLPSEEEKAVLINFILKNYGGHTPEEIRLAFEMAVSGELGIDPNCYENFSVLYFSKIMNAYREWACEEYKEVVEPPVQTIYPDEENDNLYRYDIENFYQRLRMGREQPQNAGKHFKEILVKDGLMKGDEELSSFFIQRLGKGIENVYVK